MTFDGKPVDAILGVGIGWELPLTYSLAIHLRGQLPDAAGGDWSAEHEAAIGHVAGIWAALIQGANEQS
jgi:hypothetical protein